MLIFGIIAVVILTAVLVWMVWAGGADAIETAIAAIFFRAGKPPVFLTAPVIKAYMILVWIAALTQPVFGWFVG
jgi:hypothetical protein